MTQPPVRLREGTRRRWPNGVWLWVAWGCFILAGCDDRPRAPELRDSPVYYNKQAGFRFLVPDGWQQTMSAALPTGSITGEVWVVRYTLQTAERGAMLHIMCYEHSSHPDLAKFHAEPSFSVENWVPSGAGETITVNGVNGVNGTRVIYSGASQNQKFTKEVVGFRRGSREFCFAAVFAAKDDLAREQVRRAINSLVWDG